jgi:hypothetical protein
LRTTCGSIALVTGHHRQAGSRWRRIREEQMAEQRWFTNLEAYRGRLTAELLKDAVTREEERLGRPLTDDEADTLSLLAFAPIVEYRRRHAG